MAEGAIPAQNRWTQARFIGKGGIERGGSQDAGKDQESKTGGIMSLAEVIPIQSAANLDITLEHVLQTRAAAGIGPEGDRYYHRTGTTPS